MWEHFTTEGAREGYAKCLLPGCGKEIKQGTESSTSAMIKHLKTRTHTARLGLGKGGVGKG